MPVAWRVAKKRYPVFDGTGARLTGARWNSPGRPIIYASDSFAGAILEILAHSLRPRTLPGTHHAARIAFPTELVEIIDASAVPGWATKGSLSAIAFGDRWFDEARSAVLDVPSVSARPIGRSLLINPLHAEAKRIAVSAGFDVEWDERLF
jgi:RES domain-containing protein